MSSEPRISRTHTSVSTLTDQALIAFEIEHERNRLKEELKRLQNAHDDTQRSLEILDFMSTRTDNDPLINPSLNNPFKNQLLPTLSQHSSRNSSNQSLHQIDDELELSPNLEYLPQNTFIRLSNKQVKKICDICIGDKILSLCINCYPHNGKSRHSFLPKPMLNNANSFRQKQKMEPKSPKRQRSVTAANIAIPFMLPPPLRGNSSNNVLETNNGHLTRSQTERTYTSNDQYLNDDEIKQMRNGHQAKKDSWPRKSMPFLAYHPNHDNHHNNNNNNNNNNNYHRKRNTIQTINGINGHQPNLPQSVTSVLKNESLILQNLPRVKRENSRSKSFATMLKHQHQSSGSPLPSPMSQSYKQLPAQNGHHTHHHHHQQQQQQQHRRQQQKHRHTHHQLHHHQQNGHHHHHKHNGHAHHPHSRRHPPHSHPQLHHQHSGSLPVKKNTLPQTRRNRGKSQASPLKQMQHKNASLQPNHSRHQQQTQSRSTNNSPTAKNGGFNYANSKSQNADKRNSKNKNNTNYLESVIVTQIFVTKTQKLIEIVTHTDLRIRCTPTHLFWICGKGWGCADPKSRMFLEKQTAFFNKHEKEKEKKKVRIPELIHELKSGEKLLTVSGKKFEISYIKNIDKPKGINVYSIIVNKNNSFFANDFLIKNCIE